ncbi:hypothetical protein Taro_012513, partial [Colocasia esculenta]|nr:hypothetical protein [Colocasia esculenta]
SEQTFEYMSPEALLNVSWDTEITILGLFNRLRSLMEMCILIPGVSPQHRPGVAKDHGGFSPASWKCTEEFFANQMKNRDPLKLGFPNIWALRLVRQLLVWHPKCENALGIKGYPFCQDDAKQEPNALPLWQLPIFFPTWDSGGPAIAGGRFPAITAAGGFRRSSESGHRGGFRRSPVAVSGDRRNPATAADSGDCRRPPSPAVVFGDRRRRRFPAIAGIRRAAAVSGDCRRRRF